VLSALVGIAIEQGHIEKIDQPVLDFFPGRSVKNLDDRKAAMTLEHLISMTTGLKCRDSYLYGNRGLSEMSHSEDWVQFVLDLPMEAQPGSKFEYCNGASLLLSAALQEAVGVTTAEFARQSLFEPLGIEEFDWDETPNGITFGWSRLHLEPADTVRIGQLYLEGGKWGAEQLISPDWVHISTRQHVRGTLQDGYGYGWWIASPQMYMGLGYRGQFLVIRPEENLVVLFNSDLPEQDFYLPQRLMETFILPALQNKHAALTPNPAGYERLQAAVQDLGVP
jgi:CubicO group peptidase (beta-lactamase class C family)